MFWTSKQQRFEAAQRERDREMFLAAIREVGGMVERIAETGAEQARVMRAFLDAFQVHDLPTTRTLRDVDEWRAEMERIAFMDES